MKTRVDELVGDYLARLAAAAEVLPADRRAELLAEIRGHIEAARAGGATDEPAVRTLLDRLGQPAEIVAAATDEPAPAPAAAGAGVPSGPGGPVSYPGRYPAGAAAERGVVLETVAVVMLTVGSFIPVLGWGLGAVLLWSSSRWSRREKVLGTLVVPGGPGLVLLLAAVPARTCVGGSSGPVGDVVRSTPDSCGGFALPEPVGAALAVFILVAPFVVAAVLLRRARARAADF